MQGYRVASPHPVEFAGREHDITHDSSSERNDNVCCKRLYNPEYYGNRGDGYVLLRGK